MTRLFTSAVLVAVMLVGFATPAAAHAFGYCGHRIHWHWSSRSEYVQGYTDSHGHHRHKVYVADGLLGRYWDFPHCSAH